MVTAIAEYLGIPTVDIPIVQEYRGLHYQQLLTMHFLSQTGDGLHLRMSNGNTFLLPCPELTHVTDWEFRDNWWMHTTAHMARMRALRGGPGTSRMTQRHVRPDQRVLTDEQRAEERRAAARQRRQQQQEQQTDQQETAEGVAEDEDDQEMQDLQHEIDTYGGGASSSHRGTGESSTDPDWGQFYDFMAQMEEERVAQQAERAAQAEFRRQQQIYQEEERLSRSEYRRMQEQLERQERAVQAEFRTAMYASLEQLSLRMDGIDALRTYSRRRRTDIGHDTTTDGGDDQPA